MQWSTQAKCWLSVRPGLRQMLTEGSSATEVTYWLLKPPTQPRLAGPQWQLAWLHPPGKGPATRGCLLPFKVRAGYRDTPRLRMDAPVWAAGWLQTKVQFPQCHLRGPQQVQTRSPSTRPGMGPHSPPTTYHGRQPQPRIVRPHSRRHSLKSQWHTFQSQDTCHS